MSCIDWTHLDDFTVRQGGDPIADGVQAVQIVGHHENSEAERLLQCRNQCVEIAGRDRVESGRRFIQEDNLGIESESTGKRSALGHAARQLGRKLLSVGGREADHFQFCRCEFIEQGIGNLQVLAHRKLHVLLDGERGE